MNCCILDIHWIGRLTVEPTKEFYFICRVPYSVFMPPSYMRVSHMMLNTSLSPQPDVTWSDVPNDNSRTRRGESFYMCNSWKHSSWDELDSVNIWGKKLHIYKKMSVLRNGYLELRTAEDPASFTSKRAQIPAFIYGSAWKEARTAQLIGEALRAGFVAIDTVAQPKHYREGLVGDAVRHALSQGTLRREDLFVTILPHFLQLKMTCGQADISLSA